MLETKISQQKLTSIYPEQGNTYYQFLQEWSGIADERKDVQKIYQKLLAQETKIDRTALNKLRASARKALLEPTKSVIKAKEALIYYFKSSSSAHQFIGNSVLLMVYGSLQFGDPQNLDADLLAVSGKFTPEQEVLRQTISGELVDLWQRRKLGLIKDASPHLGVCSLEDFQKPLQTILEIPENFRDCIGDLGIILSGMALLPADYHLLVKYSQQAKTISESEPLFCAMVNQSLQKCLDIRITRRSAITMPPL